MSGDRALADKLKPDDYASIRDVLVEKIKAGDVAGGLIGAIQRAADLLAPIAPCAPGDRDEIPNTLRVLD